jgi:hypothetical protein
MYEVSSHLRDVRLNLACVHAHKVKPNGPIYRGIRFQFTLADQIHIKMTDHDEDDSGWAFPKRPRLDHYIRSLMSFKHDRWNDKYPKGTEFTKDELLTLRPIDVRRWLCMRAFHKPDPDWQNDCGPTYERASSLGKAKHGVSVYMPNQHAAWIEGRGGNPTLHHSVLKVINDVTALETKGKGRKANDKRPYRQPEFDKLLEILRAFCDFDNRWKFPMMTLWAYHLIHRVDDTAHFKVDAPHGCHEWPFAVMTKTSWSKNVRSMPQCPDQILMGSADWKNCILCNLANYMEMWIGQNQNVKHLFTNNEDEEKMANQCEAAVPESD